MNPVVLDPDVVSFLFKDDSRAAAYLPHLRDRIWLISFMTEAELEQWSLLSNWQEGRTGWRFAIVPSSRDLVRKWAEAMVAARRRGRRLETADAWVAATALLYGAPLLTHNAKDYSGVPGLTLVTETDA